MRVFNVAIAVGAVVLAPAFALADIIHVYPDGSGDVPTIAKAFEIAQGGDEIALGSGTFYEHDIEMSVGCVDLYGLTGDPADVIIDAEGKGRCLHGPRVGGICEVRSITLQNGTHPVEGGLLLAGDVALAHFVTYVDCVFRNGSAPRGGAVAGHANAGQGTTFRDCRFEGNESSASGGALWIDRFAWVENCTFRDNVAGLHGGAIFHDFTTFDYLWIRASLFENNTAGGDGGALYSEGTEEDIDGSFVAESRFEGNQATNGGAIYVGEPSRNNYFFLANSVFLENTASQSGGAALLQRVLRAEDADLNSGNVFARNTAGSTGGALTILGSIRLDQSTFVENGAPSGGHFWSDPSVVTFDRTILAFATGGGAAAGSGGSVTGCLDVYGNVGGDYTGRLEGEDQVATNFSADPLFCDLSGGDYELQSGSPCAPPGATGCGLVGALGVGCNPVAVQSESWSARSWGSVKALYR